MLVMLAATAGGLAVLWVLGLGLVAAGLRAGDRPGDATVTATAAAGPRPVIVATVRNPGRPGGTGRAARRYRLTVVLGQAGGRLRVIGVPVVSRGPAEASRPARAARAAGRD